MKISADGSAISEQVLLTASVIDPRADFDPDELEFESVHVGNTTTRRARLENSGTTPLILTGLSIQGDDARISRKRMIAPTSWFRTRNARCTSHLNLVGWVCGGHN